MVKKAPHCHRPPRDPSKMGPTGLIHDISRITHEQVKKDCPEMQRSCRLIMMELAFRDNITQLDLVHATHLKAPTISVSLQKMERDGLVLRKQDPDDLRATRVFLTDKGRNIHNSIVRKIREEEARAESILSEEERKQLTDLLLKIHNHLTGGANTIEEN